MKLYKLIISFMKSTEKVRTYTVQAIKFEGVRSLLIKYYFMNECHVVMRCG